MLSSSASSIPVSWVPYSSRNWPYVRNWTSPAISKNIKKCLSQLISDILSKHLSSGQWTYNCCYKYKNIRETKLVSFFFLNTLNELCTQLSFYTATKEHSFTKPRKCTLQTYTEVRSITTPICFCTSMPSSWSSYTKFKTCWYTGCW